MSPRGDVSQEGAAMREVQIASLVHSARDEGIAGGPNPTEQLLQYLTELDVLGSNNHLLRAEIYLALGWFAGMSSGLEAAKRYLGQAIGLAPELAWRGKLQWASALFTSDNRQTEALAIFAEVIPTLAPDRHLIAALNNRGVLLNAMGRVSEAVVDLTAAAELAQGHGLLDHQSAALHNLGISYHFNGDLPLALNCMQQARLDGARIADGAREVDRGRVLFDAGLISEAAQAAETAVELAGRSQWTNDVAHAHLLGARSYAALGDYRTSLGHARRAIDAFNHIDAAAAAARARLVEVGVRLAMLADEPAISIAGLAVSIYREAEMLAEQFAEIGAPSGVVEAQVIAAGARQYAGDWSGAARQLAGLGDSEAAPLNTAPLRVRLAAQWVRARSSLHSGDPAGGLAHLREGLAELGRFHSRLGSQDLQVAASIHGVRLADLALSALIGQSDPALILEWIERTRSVTSAIPTVRPSMDPMLAERLSSFRAISAHDLTAASTGTRSRQRRIDDLRRDIRSYAWASDAISPTLDPVSVSQIRQYFGAAGDIAVEFLSFDGRVHAIEIGQDQLIYHQLGSVAEIKELVRRLTLDLDMLALPGLAVPMRQVVDSSRGLISERLDQLLIQPLGISANVGTVTIAAVGGLASLAWGQLPTLIGRPLRLSPSLTAAVTAAQNGTPTKPSKVLMVWGPDVPNAAQEWQTLSGLYPDAVLLAGAAATPSAVLAAMARADLVHISTHGHYEPESPLFSGLELAGGTLYAYELDSIKLPAQIVLSACEVGRSVDRPGGESLGLVLVLLRSGVRTVIAATSRVADATTAQTLCDFHRLLADGASAPAALAAALVHVRPSVPLTCFGL